MIIRRDFYLNQLIAARDNGMAKVITGIRRCGKSFLLNDLYRNYLLSHGVSADHVIYLQLDSIENRHLLDPESLYNEVIRRATNDQKYYVILDEIQLVGHFESLVNSLITHPNLDVYITGSNSHFLSSDIATEFRGRSWEIRVYPLSFAEYLTGINLSADQAWPIYLQCGGLPQLINLATDDERRRYVQSQADNVYLNDIVERYSIANRKILDELVRVVASNVGSLTNVNKISNTFGSNGVKVSNQTIDTYLGYLQDAFAIERADRYDVKGRKYIGASSKYYFTDIGIRNALLNFRQTEPTHLMENVIYNELKRRGYRVDVGSVESRVKTAEGSSRDNLEVDFVADKDGQLHYIQSAYLMPDQAKVDQEKRSLRLIHDGFKKIVITMNDLGRGRYFDKDGIMTIGLFDFLLNDNSLVY